MWETSPGEPDPRLQRTMHEVSIMAEAVRLAAESVRAAGGKRITRLMLRVGSLSGAVPDALEFAWDVVRRGTLADQARLEIEWVPAVFECESCRIEVACNDFTETCPRCGQPARNLRRGRELEIASVEMETDGIPSMEEQTL